MANKLIETAGAPAKLRAARAILDESQDTFGERLGISTSWLAMLESGVETPSLKLAVVIEQLTGIAPSEWLDDQRVAVA